MFANDTLASQAAISECCWSSKLVRLGSPRQRDRQVARDRHSSLGLKASLKPSANVLEVEDDALYLGHRLERCPPAEPAHTAALAGVAAEGRPAIPVGGRLVDVDHAALQPFRAGERLCEVGGVYGGAKTVAALVRQADGFL